MNCSINTGAMVRLSRNKRYLTSQQFRTLKGQILNGRYIDAMRGLDRILRKRDGRRVKSE